MLLHNLQRACFACAGRVVNGQAIRVLILSELSRTPFCYVWNWNNLSWFVRLVQAPLPHAEQHLCLLALREEALLKAVAPLACFIQTRKL